MEVVGIYIVPLLAGYIFSITWAGSRYQVARESDYRIYFRAIFYAIFLVGCSFLLHIIFGIYVGGPREWIVSSVRFLFHRCFSITCCTEQSMQYSLVMGSLLVSFIFGHSLNLLRFIKHHAVKWAIRNDDFEIMVKMSLTRTMPIAVTLTTGKVYIGFAVRTDDPVEERKDLRLLPLLSGYRDERQGLCIEVNYRTAYDVILDPDSSSLDHLAIGDFEVVIMCREIVSSNFFDVAAYVKFNEDDQESLPFQSDVVACL